MTDNRGPQLQAVCATFVSIAFVAVVLRIYVRLRMVKAFGWDDAWMVGAVISHIMFATCAIGGIHYGTGRHMTTLTNEQIYKALRYWWLCYIAYCASMICVKISISLFLLRVIIHRLHRWIIYVCMALTVITGAVFFLVTLLQCSPIPYFWNRAIPGGSCINVEVIIALTFFYSAVNAICDFTLGILPIFLVKDLKMERRVKVALVPLLSMACIASAAVVVRMAYVQRFRGADFLYDTVDIAIWSDIEQGLAITAGSLATLRPLYRSLSERFGWSHVGTPMIASGKQTPYAKRSSMSNQRKKSNPFSISNFTRTGNRTSDEEYGLGNVRPIQLRDDLVDETQKGKGDQGFRSWRVEVGDEGSEEELHKKPGFEGITRQTDVYMKSSFHAS